MVALAPDLGGHLFAHSLSRSILISELYSLRSSGSFSIGEIADGLAVQGPQRRTTTPFRSHQSRASSGAMPKNGRLPP